MSTRQVFGGILAVVLLCLFVYLLWIAFDIARSVVASCSPGDLLCQDRARSGFLPGMETGLSTIGGLVAAIVIAELAITKPPEFPAARLFSSPGASGESSIVVKASALAYLTVWASTGLGAYVWASLHHPDALKALTNYGNAWLGLAIASGYSYFGVDPSR